MCKYIIYTVYIYIYAHTNMHCFSEDPDDAGRIELAQVQRFADRALKQDQPSSRKTVLVANHAHTDRLEDV